MGIETPPKYVNRELNSQIGIRGQNSHISDGAPPTSMLLWGAAHSVTRIYVMHITSVHTSIQGDEKNYTLSLILPLWQQAPKSEKRRKKDTTNLI
jgi:hypothetical protein